MKLLKNVEFNPDGSVDGQMYTEVQIMDRLKLEGYENSGIYVVSGITRPVDGSFPWQVSTISETIIPEGFKGIGWIDGAMHWITFYGITPMSKERQDELAAMGLNDFGRKHYLTGY